MYMMLLVNPIFAFRESETDRNNFSYKLIGKLKLITHILSVIRAEVHKLAARVKGKQITHSTIACLKKEISILRKVASI